MPVDPAPPESANGVRSGTRRAARGVEISPWEFTRLGGAGVPVLLLTSWDALLLTS